MITVGYGDISPKTKIEKIYTIIMTLCSSINFAYVVNTIGSIYADIASKEYKLSNTKFVIWKYLKDRKID